MNQKSILKAVKIALAHEVKHFNIRLIIRLLSKPNEPIDIRQKIDGADRKISNEEAVELTTLNCGEALRVSKLKRCTYALTFDNSQFLFKGKDVYKNTGDDKEADFANQAYEIWMGHIGTDKNIFKRTPTLTSSKANKYSKGGRLETLTRAYRTKAVTSLEEVERVCVGCRTSLYHMGYDKYGRKAKKHYCDIPTLFLSRQRVEEFMSRADEGVDYLKQLESLEQITRLKNSLESNEGILEVECDISLDDLISSDLEGENTNEEEFTLEDLIA